MCLIAFAFDSHPRYRLVLVANRDEFLDRESEPARFWPDAPHLLAGRDLRAGGTWLGITTGGKIAAVTNYRDPRQQVIDPPSRGALVADYLRNERMTAADLQAHLLRSGNSYDGFNLIYGTVSELHYFTNRGGSSGPITPGVHALSNHLLDTRWPKLVEAKNRLEAILQQDHPSMADLFVAMSDPAPFADELLPDTGIGPEFERFLSPILIKGDRYATRSTTVLLVSRNGEVSFCEKIHDAKGEEPHCFRFPLIPHP
jgi:uncharacterized protein with NRDE domain